MLFSYKPHSYEIRTHISIQLTEVPDVSYSDEYAKSLLVLQNFTIARKSGNIALAYYA